MSSLPSNNETVGGNNTINGNGYPLSSSMNLFNQQSSSGARSGDEHRNGNETENENEDSRKGLAWMPRQFDVDKQRRAGKKAEEKERKANGTVKHHSRNDKVLTENGKIKTMSDASLETYNSANSGIRKINEAKKDNGLQLAQKFMRVVVAKPKMNVYDHDTQNVSSKNLPELARLVLEKQVVSSATTADFLQQTKRAGWDYTDPRKNNSLPIEKGQVFEFFRKDDLFDMNDDEKVARIVYRNPPPLARGSANTNWLQKEIDDLFEIVSKFGTGNWAEIEAKFKEKHPSTSRTLRGIKSKYYAFKKKYEETKLAAKKHSDEKKSTKGATTSAANGAEAEMAVSASDKKRASKKSSKSASVAEADMLKKKRKTDLPASSDKENEENLKPASDKKPASESPKKKSALEDSMNLSDYSSDQDEAESPKKTDWDQLEMNSDEESYNSCDEDSSSDEAALPWTDKDDDEWKPEK